MCHHRVSTQQTENANDNSGLPLSQEGPGSSQESRWFTQQTFQQKKSNVHTELLHELPASLDLVPVRPYQCSNLSQNQSQKESSSNRISEKIGNSHIDIKELLIKMLPILVKFFLAKQPTEKIACIIEIAELLGAESTISSLIAGMGLTQQ